MSQVNQTIPDLLEYIDQTRKDLEALVDGTDPALEVCPGWTLKDTIGHITAWEIVIHKAIQAFLSGGEPYFLREQDFDIFNSEAVAIRKDWSFEQILDEYRQVRMKLREDITRVAEDSLSEELVLPWGSERTMAELIEIIGEHETEHLDAMVKAAG